MAHKLAELEKEEITLPHSECCTPPLLLVGCWKFWPKSNNSSGSQFNMTCHINPAT